MANEKVPETAKPRQAVLLIHGIGEQRPMDTLRSFVSAFLRGDGYYSKPDTMSESYELRRFKLRRYVSRDGASTVNPDWPETDFYEFYWAHFMYGTTVAHIAAWLWRVMREGAGLVVQESPRIHPRLKRMVVLAWAAAGVALVAAVWFLLRRRSVPTTMVVMSSAATLVAAAWALGRQALLGIVTDFIGDAARYLDVNPKNVARRYDIIRSGVTALRKLHIEHDEDCGKVMYRYGRVVVVGHSLGSVIAYDILRHYWHEVNGTIRVNPTDFSEVERFDGGNGRGCGDGAPTYTDRALFRQRQHEAWHAVNVARPSGEELVVGPPHEARWLVSDLVTLGSPLTYAPLLLADGVEELQRKQELRELPTCPPDRSRHLNPGRFTVKLSAEADRIHDYDILHHGAHLAMTRWTNFYFHNDPIAGELSATFGQGIEDVALQGPVGRPIHAHVGYWNRALSGGEQAVALMTRILQDGAFR